MPAVTANPSFTSTQLRGVERTWREYRNYSPRQALWADFLTNQGVFAANPKRNPHGLYGGAMWGGKSHGLRSVSFEICMVLRDLGFPNQWGCLWCDTYPNLQQRHIVKYIEEFAGIGTVSETRDRGLHVKWHGQGLGGVYLRNVADQNSQSKGVGTGRGFEVSFGLADELTEFLRAQFGAMMYQVRSGRPDFPFFARGFGSNPDGQGHGWVKEMFIPEYINLEDDYIRKMGRESFFFVPALPSDNPAYDSMGDVVMANAAALDDEDIRRARETGDWDIYQNGRFSMWRRDLHTFTWSEFFFRFSIPEDMGPREFLENARTFGFELYASLDYGTSERSISAYLLHAVDPDGRPWTVAELGMSGMELEDQADAIKAFEKRLPITNRFADPSIGGKAQMSDQKTRLERFRDCGLNFILGVRDRVEGASTIASLLYVKRDEFGCVVKEARWRVLRETTDGFGCPELIKQIPALPRDPHNPEDVHPRDGQNHWYDSARYFLHTRFQGGFVPDEIQIYSAAYWREIANNHRQPQGDPRWWRR